MFIPPRFKPIDQMDNLEIIKEKNKLNKIIKLYEKRYDKEQLNPVFEDDKFIYEIYFSRLFELVIEIKKRIQSGKWIYFEEEQL